MYTKEAEDYSRARNIGETNFMVPARRYDRFYTIYI